MYFQTLSGELAHSGEDGGEGRERESQGEASDASAAHSHCPENLEERRKQGHLLQATSQALKEIHA